MLRYNGFTIDKKGPVRVGIGLLRPRGGDIFDPSTIARLGRLRRIYRRIPETECDGCGRCCYSLRVRPVYSIEYLNILRYIKKRFPQRELGTLTALSRARLWGGRVRGGKLPKKWRVCMFRDERKRVCRVYESRPLVCRLYGLRFASIKSAEARRYICRKLKVKDAKMRKQLDPAVHASLWEGLSALSELYIHASRGRDAFSVTNHRDLNDWFSKG